MANENVTIIVTRGDTYLTLDKFEVKVALEEHEDAKAIFSRLRDIALNAEHAIRAQHNGK